MTRIPYSVALKELTARNTLITAAYRDWSRRLPPGPTSRLASSMAAQRLDLGKAFETLASDRSALDAEIELDTEPNAAAGSDSASVATMEPDALLRRMVEAEAAEHELLAALAGAILPASGPAAELLASEAASARKRSIWAQDQLELMGLG